MNDEFKPYPPLDLIEERLFAGPPTGTQEPHVETAPGGCPATGWPFAVVA